MWYVPTLFLSQSPHISPCIALLSLMRELVVLYSTAYDPQPQMIPCTVLFTLLVDCKQLSFFPQSQCSKLCKLMVKRRRDWGIWSPTANDPLYSTFYPFSRLQAVVLLSSEPMQQIVQVNGKKEERLGQREEKGLLCFLLLGSTLISSPLPSVHILPCLKRKIRDCLQSIY